jgi:hypothetical protein
MSQEALTTRSNVNLRRIELTLISRLNQLEIQLQRLSEAQEHHRLFAANISPPSSVIIYRIHRTIPG